MKKQGGASLVAILTSLMLAVFIFSCVVKLTPLYNDDITARGIIDAFDESHNLKDASVADIQGWIARGFWMNAMSPEIEKATKVWREGNKIVVEVNYERRVHMIYNIDAILTFKNIRKIDLG
ncbi:MAG: DUF4845 domain-containing protein [Endozoicomonadaceae bacterium]|nr:DUF4845 domain-containing protein [Endozoicomonadaceae bacterium]